MIEVGEYVRVNGIIGRVEQVGNSLFWLEDGSSYSLFDKTIKHSKNIIDLLEVGDIIAMLDTKFNTKDYIFIDDIEMLQAVKTDLKDRCKLLSILTKEQYMQNCYKIDTN